MELRQVEIKSSAISLLPPKVFRKLRI